jgi:hypothetical protein
MRVFRFVRVGCAPFMVAWCVGFGLYDLWSAITYGQWWGWAAMACMALLSAGWLAIALLQRRQRRIARVSIARIKAISDAAPIRRSL